MEFILPWSLFGVGINALHAGVVEMPVKEHFQLAVGRFAAGAGIVPCQCQRTGEHVHRHEHRQRRRHPRADMAAHLFISFSTSG